MAKWITPAQPLIQPMPRPTDNESRELDMPRIAGIDTETGLARVQGNRRLYLKLLLKFRDSQADFISQFRAAQESDDPDAATRCAHTLKGVAGNIGIETVQKAARDLESTSKAGKPKDEIDAALDRVMAALEPVLNGLERLDDARPSGAHTPVDPEHLRELLRKLRGMLENYDGEAVYIAEELAEQSGLTDRQADLDKLVTLVEDFEFEAALEVLESLERLVENGG